MKKEYYIQGDPARADKIKAAFERLGINVLDFGFADKTVVYCSIGGCGGCVQYLPYSINLMNILYSHPGYTELPLSVEPKFKTGDWVVKKDGKTFCGGKYAEQITLIGTDEKGKHMFLSSSTWVNEDDDDIRLWTIQDAKDGDVLATDNGWTCIFKAFDGCVFSSYCFMDSENWFCEFGSEAHTPDSRLNGNIHPATKEQRDLLFKKMKEAGYIWDGEKKELLSAVPKFKAGDWITDGNITIQIEDVRNNSYTYSDGVLYSTRTADKVYHLWSIEDAKDGDVLSVDFNGFRKIVIFKSLSDKGVEGYGITAFKDSVDFPTSYGKEYYSKTWTKTLTPATKEQRSRLFTELEKAGYKWDAEKKELRKIQHYDIANFKPFDKVLVRDRNDEPWRIAFYGYYNEEAHYSHFVGTCWSKQCIPFNKDTKHLLGTTDPCDEFYVNW